MGQITAATIKLIRAHTKEGTRPPLTAWEIDQLATAWERLNALQPSASVEPVQGWKLVPADATNEMCIAGMKRMFEDRGYSAAWEDVFFNCYRAMLAASPPPVTAAREQEASATGAEPAAWQERQQTDHFDGWTSWYDTNSTKVVGKTEAFEVKSSGVRYQFRPLFTYRHLREYAAIARQQGRDEMREWAVEKAAKMAEQMTMRQRLMRAAGDAKPVQPCEIAAAIRSIGTPKSAEGEGA